MVSVVCYHATLDDHNIDDATAVADLPISTSSLAVRTLSQSQRPAIKDEPPVHLVFAKYEGGYQSTSNDKRAAHGKGWRRILRRVYRASSTVRRTRCWKEDERTAHHRAAIP